MVAFGSLGKTESLDASKVTLISYLNRLDHLYLNPKLNSVPADPPPQTIKFGVIPYSNKKFSFY